MSCDKETQKMLDHFGEGWAEKQKVWGRKPSLNCQCENPEHNTHPYSNICVACGLKIIPGPNGYVKPKNFNPVS